MAHAAGSSNSFNISGLIFLFRFVLKKFFTNGEENENKEATKTEALMSTMTQIRRIAGRAQYTLIQDALGAAALVVMLVVGLHLPSFI